MHSRYLLSPGIGDRANDIRIYAQDKPPPVPDLARSPGKYRATMRSWGSDILFSQNNSIVHDCYRHSASTTLASHPGGGGGTPYEHLKSITALPRAGRPLTRECAPIRRSKKIPVLEVILCFRHALFRKPRQEILRLEPQPTVGPVETIRGTPARVERKVDTPPGVGGPVGMYM